jgi:GntR family transcriptional regulator, transcriptional repressor for pyruvate dehydrogenase complex
MPDRRPASTPGARFSPVKADASEEIARRIRAHLEQHGLRPGVRIGTEQTLAREFGVSRPTLREALRLLSASHLIRVGRGRAGGVFVANTPNEGMSRTLSESIATMLATDSVSLHQLLDARQFLEVPLAGMAAEHASEPTVDALERAVADAEGRDPAGDEFRLADTRFHRALAVAAGNELLVAFTSWTLDVLQPSLVERLGPALDGDAIVDQHRAILRAVRRRQGEAARRAMARHLGYMRTLLVEVDGDGTPLDAPGR